MAGEWTIGKPFDAVDAAVATHLSSLRSEHPHLSYEAKPTTPVSIVYYFNLGYYGKLTVRKLDATTSMLSITDPPASYIDGKTPEELAKQRYSHLWAASVGETKRQAAIRTCEQEIAGRQKMLESYRMVSEELLKRLEEDGFLGEKAAVPVAPDDVTSATEPVFHQRGEMWLLSYRGETVYLEDLKGLHYIRLLLQRPGREAHAFELVKIVEGITDDVILGSAGDVINDQAFEEYRSRYEELRDELREAEENNDRWRVEKLREEQRWLADEIGGARGLGGRRRQASDDVQRARQRVSKAIARSLSVIQKHHEGLWRHLSSSITTGQFLSYTPETPIIWTT